MNLFISLYIDEDVSVLIADLVRARGFDAITTREAGLRGTPDAEQLHYATQHQRAFLTHNRADFEALAETYFHAGQTHYGIIIARRHLPYELAQRVLLILNQVTADEMQNLIKYI